MIILLSYAGSCSSETRPVEPGDVPRVVVIVLAVVTVHHDVVIVVSLADINACVVSICRPAATSSRTSVFLTGQPRVDVLKHGIALNMAWQV